MKPALLALVSLAALAGLAQPAQAHPHVWITAEAEIVYAADGKVSGVRHHWTFDAGYSAYLTQGLDKNGDGKLTPDELQDMAKENAEIARRIRLFHRPQGERREAGLRAAARIRHDLRERPGAPLARPAREKPADGKTLSLEVYDPSFFVSFSLAEGDDAVRLPARPKGCAATVARPKPVAADQQKLSESFFEALTSASNYGSNFANRAIVACP